MKASKIIRCLLTLLLIYGVYTETGIWTTLSMILIFIAFELIAIKRRRES